MRLLELLQRLFKKPSAGCGYNLLKEHHRDCNVDDQHKGGEAMLLFIIKRIRCVLILSTELLYMRAIIVFVIIRQLCYSA